MVEFDSIESATRARDNLNGCDIYSACCTLKIDYAKVRRDFTFPHLVDTWPRQMTSSPLPLPVINWKHFNIDVSSFTSHC